LNSNDFKYAKYINPALVKSKIENVINDKNATFFDGEESWKALMPYVWEKSLQYAR
jgi:hypothetical protein